MPTGSKKVRAAAMASKKKQEKLFKRKTRQLNIAFLKKARKRGFK